MRNCIINGDCLVEMDRIPDKFVDLICADLPYGVTGNKWDSVIPLNDHVNGVGFEEFLIEGFFHGRKYDDLIKEFESRKEQGLWSKYKRVIKDNGAILLFGQDKFSARLMLSNEKWHRYNLIWEKTQPTGFLNANRMPLRAHEDILVFYKKLPTYNPQKTSGHPRKVASKKNRVDAVKRVNELESYTYGKQYESKIKGYDSTDRHPRSVWKFKKDMQKSALHPTQKPVDLIKELIFTYSNPGDVVLDNTCGSGTTGIAAVETGRDFILIEKGKDEYECAVARINDHESVSSFTSDGTNTCWFHVVN